jgi:uncharacterized membrane protein (DUF373 family)
VILQPNEFDTFHRIFLLEMIMKHEELPENHSDPLLNILHIAIRFGIRVLAILMVLVIFWSIADVIYVLYQKLSAPPFFLLDMEDILQTFGAFMLVLIAVEIFINIRLYLGSNVIPVELVVATALMAVARKVIVLDLKLVSAEQIVGLALVTIALGVTYWLIKNKTLTP